MKFSVQAGALTAVLAIAARSCGKSGDRNFVELCVEEKWPSRLTVRAVSLGSVSLTARMDLDAQGVAGTEAGQFTAGRRNRGDERVEHDTGDRKSVV